MRLLVVACGDLVFVELKGLLFDEGLVVMERMRLFILRFEVFAPKPIEYVAGISKAHLRLRFHYHKIITKVCRSLRNAR